LKPRLPSRILEDTRIQRGRLNMGSAGNLPDTVGNLPTGTAEGAAWQATDFLGSTRDSRSVGLVARRYRLAACSTHSRGTESAETFVHLPGRIRLR
jgi:hypothetical protein